MAGIYLHIPFCAKRCLYCDFFSNTQMSYKEEYIEALLEELELRCSYIGNEAVETIYFGGGTPSQLRPDDFKRIFDMIYRLYDVTHYKEITLEANPDDLTAEYVSSLRTLPFNRLSIGIQSFREEDLCFLNRRHTALQAMEAVKRCQDNGFCNVSIDLMYGLPHQTLEEWEKNLDKAISLNVQHISAYHLIYEEGTSLYKLKETGKIKPVPEEVSVAMFSLLMDKLKEVGFVHYEISNFGKAGFFSLHNSSYWMGKKYGGFGASAHSFNGKTRQWNVSSLFSYIKGMKTKHPDIEEESLAEHTKYNEFIITGLRTMWGIDLNIIKEQFGEFYYNYCLHQAGRPIERGLLKRENTTLKLTREGIFISDGIMSDLLYI